MTQTHTFNRHIQLASRPVGAPTVADFHLGKSSVPNTGPGRCCRPPPGSLPTYYLCLPELHAAIRFTVDPKQS